MRHEHVLWFSTDCPLFVAYSLRVEKQLTTLAVPKLIVPRLHCDGKGLTMVSIHLATRS